jgi:DNA polymerase
MDMLAALKLQIEWGADEALDEAPVDRMAPVAVAAPLVAPKLAPPSPKLAPKLAPAARAQAVAEAANTTEALRQALASFTDCPLATTATNLVFADGNPLAGLVVVGEAPGAEEDLAGKPFVGPAGQFLDQMFGSIGLTRADMLLTNLIPWRPPGNRPVTEAEMQTCLPFLQRHLTLLRPRLLVTLGALPVRALTGRDDGIRKMRGRWTQLQIAGLPATIPMLAMLHPAYVQQTPGAKRDSWADLISLRKALNTL